MKSFNINLYLILFLLIGLINVSCEEDIEGDLFNTSNLDETIIQFNESSSTLDLPISPEGDLETEIRVGVSSVSNTDRRVTLRIAPESTLPASAYSIEDVVIPAGQYEGVGVITTIQNTAFDTSQTLILDIAGVEGTNTPIQFDNRIQQITFTSFEFCPFEPSLFLGDYAVTTLTPGIFNVGIYGTDGGIVTLSVGANPAQRVFSADYIADAGFGSFPRNFTLSFICGEIIVGETDTGLFCATGQPNLVVTDPGVFGVDSATYNETDDSSFMVIAVDNSISSCGTGPVLTTYRFDKQ